MENDKTAETLSNVSKEELWYLNNYVLLRDYYDRTISRIAARCIRKGNIAIEDYHFYGYILDVLEEITEVGDYLVEHKNLYPYIEKKIAGGVNSLVKNLREYKEELVRNSSPDMIKEDDGKEIDAMKKILGDVQKENKGFDPTKGAGMSMDDLMSKLLNENKEAQEIEARKNEMIEPQGQEEEIKKMIKVKKPVNPASRQAIPEKNDTEE